ncbi:hypothetical protein [Acidovorax sp. sic0104]|uniref:hypothetical protein n=1 Tax=Acidovorax sp. sic0104 TaxID=2854784 RepID=UPI001C441D74|nr:hypothetical protein [Acidovorax sp. sic0104]MBV7542256.1 hypothetical protein [Acidovorax sp. sic0104]
MNARHNAIHHRTRQGAVAVRGAFIAQASSTCSKRLPLHAASYLQGHDRMGSSASMDQPQWLGNGFEDTAPLPGGGCNAGQ